MTYATRADMEARYGSAEIAELAMDDGEAEVDRIGVALADACSVIDAHLGVCYALPLSTEATYPMLRDIVCDLARADLYDDSELDAPKRLERRAIERLEKLRDGKMNLVDADGNVVPRRNLAKRVGPDPQFNRKAFEGY